MGTRQRSALERRTRARPPVLRHRAIRVLGTAATASMDASTPPRTLSRKAWWRKGGGHGGGGSGECGGW
jgi:hypothetical protein